PPYRPPLSRRSASRIRSSASCRSWDLFTTPTSAYALTKPAFILPRFRSRAQRVTRTGTAGVAGHEAATRQTQRLWRGGAEPGGAACHRGRANSWTESRHTRLAGRKAACPGSCLLQFPFDGRLFGSRAGPARGRVGIAAPHVRNAASGG